MDLLDDHGCLRRVVDYAPRPHEVESVIRELELARVHPFQAGRKLAQGHPAGGRIDAGIGNIDRGQIGARPRHQLRMQPHAASDLKHVAALQTFEWYNLIKWRLVVREETMGMH